MSCTNNPPASCYTVFALMTLGQLLDDVRSGFLALFLQSVNL